MKQIEHLEQCAFFQWCKLSESKYPELALIHAIPNGGKRDIRVAMKMNREGVKPGIPDIFLPVARSGFHGLYIEMKAKGGTVTPSQRDFHEKLKAQDYTVSVCYSMEHAKTDTIMYLAGKKHGSN